MPWNWQLPNWPNFTFNAEKVASLDKQFLLEIGGSCAFLKSITDDERKQFIVEILSTEGLESSKIEGEILDRKSLQSSIKKHFGMTTSHISDVKKREPKKEERMASLLYHVYETYDQPLTHEMLFQWHNILFDIGHLSSKNKTTIDHGKYRMHEEPMQIVSSRYDTSRVFFEAPPSEQVMHEMSRFLHWFNSETHNESTLCRAAIAHVYFESIHPFEDGNGRIGRAIVEKLLSKSIGRPVLIAISKILESDKKQYYAALERCNKTLDVQHWIEFFANAILQAQKESIDLLNFLIKKAKLFTVLSGQINERQEKALLRMFAEGLRGFQGGLSAENYISITKTSRATATRDLTDLVEKGALLKTGQLRHTRYWLNI